LVGTVADLTPTRGKGHIFLYSVAAGQGPGVNYHPVHCTGWLKLVRLEDFPAKSGQKQKCGSALYVELASSAKHPICMAKINGSDLT
jgi:hypothetical protein